MDNPILAALAGLLAGLLVNYLGDVLPQTRRLTRPDWWPPGRSASYFHSARVWLVIAFFLVFALSISLAPPAGVSALSLLLIATYFGVVVVIDVEHRVIMHPVSLFGALAFGLWGVLRRSWLATLLGGVAGFLIMLALYYLGELLGRWLARRRREELDEVPLGFGDVNLAGVIGLLVGWPSVLAALMLAFLLGGVFSMGYIVVQMARRQYSAFSALAYGPFLALGALGLILLRAYVN